MTRSKLAPLPCAIFTSEQTITWFERRLLGSPTGPCGWLKDKFGLSWQVSPVVLGDMLADQDAARAERVMAAMLDMEKIDIAALKRAYEEK